MQCEFIKQDGTQCEANAMKNSNLCFTHNPNKKAERALAVKRGGMSPKKNYNPLPPVKLEEQKDVVILLSTTINEVRQGEIDLRVANCIGYLSNVLIKALSEGELESRLEEVERIIFERKTTIRRR